MVKYEVYIQGKKYEVDVEEVEPDVFNVTVGDKKTVIRISEVAPFVHVGAVEESVSKIEERPEVKDEVKVEKEKIEGEGTPIRVAMAGTITKILKKEGEEVKAGEDILILEAMKMENAISSPVSGRITKLVVNPGDRVAAGDIVAFVS